MSALLQYLIARTAIKYRPLRKVSHTKTNVGRLIEAKGPKLKRKINAILSNAATEFAAQIVAKYEARLMKVSTDDQAIIKQILEALEIDIISADIVDAITPEMIRAFKNAGIEGFASVGVTASTAAAAKLDQAALDYVDRHGGQLIKDLAGTTMEDLRGVLSNAVEEGFSPGKLSNAIQELGTFGDARGDMIARTELAFAHVAGNIDAWRETGLVVGKEWHAYDNCCDRCLELDGVIVDLDEEFPNDGGDGPPLHPNCECSILSVKADAPDEGDTEEE